MQAPDEEPESPDSFELDDLEEALGKIPPEDFDQLRQEALKEMHAEAMSGMPTPMWFPAEVLERVYTYEKEHSIDRDKMIPAAIIATKGRTEEVVEMMNRFLKDPDSFEWPIEDPLLCVSIAFMRACANWLTRKINEEYGDNEDEDEPADWWKEPE